MISIIVPVYNVEPYLRKCLDSIINQTYRDLEILIIDDGSTDGSGEICNEYAASDHRLQVIHQNNKGLSEARNSGIDIATGDYILFVDGDDWIESNTVECLYQACLDHNAEVSCCGHYKEFADRTTVHSLVTSKKEYEGEEIVVPAMKGSFAHYAWEKLWERSLFEECRFPSGMQFEDVATTWKLFLRCNKVVCIPDVLFHYTYRKDSIGNTKTMKNLADRWAAFKERYDMMSDKSDELKRICTMGCLQTIGYTWRWLYIVKDRDEKKLNEMREFLKNNREAIRSCSLPTRISLFCALYSNLVTIAGCYQINQIYRKIRGLNQMI